MKLNSWTWSNDVVMQNIPMDLKGESDEKRKKCMEDTS